jgi:hypothetical protein
MTCLIYAVPGIGLAYQAYQEIGIRIGSRQPGEKDNTIKGVTDKLKVTQDLLHIEREALLPTLFQVAIGFLAAALLSWNAIGLTVLSLAFGHSAVNMVLLAKNDHIEQFLGGQLTSQ